jgi:hypothetical protein
VVLSLLLNQPAVTIDFESLQQWTVANWMEHLREVANAPLLPVMHFLVSTSNLSVPQPVAAFLQRAYGGQLRRHAALKQAHDDAESVLRRAGIDFRRFKGLELGESLYPWPELRYSRDVDIVVRPQQFAYAREALQRNGWTLAASIPLHDTLSKLGVLLDVHRRLAGRGESVLFGIGAAAVERYLGATLSPDEEYSLLAVRMFADKDFTLARLLDLYLFRLVKSMGVRSIAVTQQWDAHYPIAVMESRLAFHGALERESANGSRMVRAWRHKRLWPFVKYPLAAITGTKRIRKAISILFPSEEELDEHARGSRLRHLLSMGSVFFGLRGAGWAHFRTGNRQ